LLRLAGILAVLALFVAGPVADTSLHAQTHKHPPAGKQKTGKAARGSGAQLSRAGSPVRGKGGRVGRARVVLRKHGRKHPLSAKALARTHKIQQAFIASSQLRPMAQQLGNYRSPAAYAGVSAFARAHSGEAASAAYLALGHAYLLDHRFEDALTALHQADAQGDALGDYTAYFAAQADLQSNQLAAAEVILGSFPAKFPDSIFIAAVSVLEANAFLQQGDPQAALRVLRAHAAEPVAEKPDYLLALAKAQQMAGQSAEATTLFRRIVANSPLSNEATIAQAQLTQSGQWQGLPIEERRRHADTLFSAGRYAPAADEFRALAGDSQLNQAERDSLLISSAACDWKLKHLTREELDRVPDSNDETGAHRQYLLMELARNNNDTTTQQAIVSAMEQRFPSSNWLSEALYSSGNMYLLRKDFPTAIQYYTEQARRFPRSEHASAAHWRAAWLNYRIRNYSEASRLMDEQLALFPGGKEVPAALYWRGRLYLDQERQPAMAAAYFSTETRVYRHYYYAAIAQERLAALGGVTPATVNMLNNMHAETIPTLTEDVPEDDPHLAKARLLANAGLNDFLSQEIHAAEGSDSWGSLAEARLYASYGEAFRAMRSLKRAIPFYTSAPIEALPLAYWRILFPQDYWATIKTESERNGLNPYMVASLIRQESEFNPRAISNANAWGLMQLLPSVGREMAKREGMGSHLEAEALLDPTINIKLGTAYLKQTLDKFGGHQEYAFAAYNAGDNRVTDWQSASSYTGLDEFVESIPFTETRDYVQAIIRNEQIYREIDQQGGASAVASSKIQAAGGAQ
jgi:soluble lytic murein transglycosylase